MNSRNYLSKYILPTASLVLTGLFLSSCADDVVQDSTTEEMPAEMCFMTNLGYYATTPSTRSTINGVWDTNELVAVAIGNELKQHKIRKARIGSGVGYYLVGNGPENTYYWMTPTDPAKMAKAWYLGKWASEDPSQLDMSCPGAFTVAADQTEGLTKSDFIYAPLSEVTYSKQGPLFFYHQLALLTIRLDLGQGLIKELLVGTTDDPVIIGGEFTAPEGDEHFGSWDTSAGATGVVSACQLASSDKEDYPLCFQCVMMPQNRNGKPFITVVLKSGERYTWVDNDNCTNWIPGVSYAYNFKLRNGLIENVTAEEWLPEEQQGYIHVVATMWDGTALPYGVTANTDDWEEFTETFGFNVNDDWWHRTDLSQGIIDETVEWLHYEQSFGINIFDTPWTDQACPGGITTDLEQWEQGSDQSGLDVTNHPWGEDTKEDDVIVKDDEWEQGSDPGGIKPTVNPWGGGEEHDTPDGVTTTPWQEGSETPGGGVTTTPWQEDPNQD